MQASPVPGGGGGLGVPPVAEAGERRHVAPDGAAAADSARRRRRVGGGDRGDAESPARAGPADGAGTLEPLLGRADRELGLGGAVELPDAAGPDPFHDGRA